MPRLKKFFTSPLGGAIVITTLIIVCYCQILNFSFLTFDDHWLVLENIFIKKFSLANLRTIFFDFSYETRWILGAEYLPIFDLFSAIDWSFWQNNAQGYHLTNLLLYVFLCLTLYAILTKLTLSKGLVLACCSLFIVHPAHSVVVATITERRSLLALLFMLLSFLSYLKLEEKNCRKALYFICSLLALTAACLSKQFAIVLPLLVFSYHLLLRRENWRELFSLKNKWPLLALLLVATFFFFLHLDVARRSGIIESRQSDNLLLNIIASFDLVGRYFSLLIYPFHQAIIFKVPRPEQLSYFSLIMALLLPLILLFIIFAFYQKKINHWLVFATAWLIISLLPFIQIVPIVDRLRWRYLFPASVAISLAPLALEKIYKKSRKNKIICLAAIYLIAALFSLQSFSLLPRYKNDIALWSKISRNHPKDFGSWVNLSKFQSQQGHYRDALSAAKNLSLYHPENPRSHLILGLRYLPLNDLTKAEAAFNKAIALKEDYKEAWLNLSFVYQHKQQLTKALKAAERALAIDNRYFLAWLRLADLQFLQKDYQAAKESLARAAKIRPTAKIVKQKMIKISSFL